jgi:hypothetical protein
MSSTPEPDPPGKVEPPEAKGFDTAMQHQTQIVPKTRSAIPFAYDPSAFDVWLRNELNLLHSAVMSEPVPQHLLDILRQPKPD